MLNRKLTEMETDTRAKEKDYASQLNEMQQLIKKQKEDLRSLHFKLDSLEEEFAQTKLKLSESEGRIIGLENEIVKVESKVDLFYPFNFGVFRLTFFFQ